MKPGTYWPMALAGALLTLMACGALVALIVAIMME